MPPVCSHLFCIYSRHCTLHSIKVTCCCFWTASGNSRSHLTVECLRDLLCLHPTLVILSGSVFTVLTVGLGCFFWIAFVSSCLGESVTNLTISVTNTDLIYNPFSFPSARLNVDKIIGPKFQLSWTPNTLCMSVNPVGSILKLYLECSHSILPLRSKPSLLARFSILLLCLSRPFPTEYFW